MDLKDIEAWGRELLEHEAAKRGIRSPEVYSRTDLVRLILKHDYGAPRNVKEAARLIGGIFGSAKQVLKKRLSPLQAPGVKTYVGAARDAERRRGAAAHGAEHARGDQARGAKQTPNDERPGLRDALTGMKPLDLQGATHVRDATSQDTGRPVHAEARSRDADARVASQTRGADSEGQSQAIRQAEQEPRVGGADLRTLESARARHVGAETRSQSSAQAFAGGAESEILERSYVGDRNLELPTTGASSSASSRSTQDIEHSYVGGRKLDLSVTASEGAAGRDIEWSHVGGTAANRTSVDEAAPEHARSEDDADALREAEQVRAEARDARKESERVRSDSRAAGQAEADRARPEPGWHRVRLGRDLPPTAAKPEARRGAPPAAERGQVSDDAAARRDSPFDPAETQDARAAASQTTAVDAPVPHLRLVEPLPRSKDEVQATSPEPVAEAPRAPEPTEQLAYGPHPQDGLLLRWRVTDDAIERARQVLGSKGELAVRIVAVRVEPHAVVRTEVIDHGPIAATGDWTAPLLPTEAKYVSAIGLRSADKFVSIVHAKS